MAQPLKINTYVSIVNKAPQEYPVQTRKTTILEYPLTKVTDKKF